ncbi:glutathione S-transferase [Panacagrimonas perspica]|uniref:Glutathione S-transferase n=1 Tax=Panacagrimonas perspica TaxID=381431 RepID=A0A4R7P047_9GAMM|nr:glutathione S-transferase family protein [Panacagrimonas perspica]TDU26612.1 glutathione S-transferase [Panacagrimonas perspica]THD03973.1 glutathione S-transferase [Panacagrimonas perspica]
MKLFAMTGSGNCWKAATLMEQLGIAFEWIEVDVVGGATRTPAFLARNPNGKVPLLEIRPGQYLAESNAMLCYLAEGSPLLPKERYARAKVLEWMFFEQYSHEPYIATVRYWVKFLGKRDEWKEKIATAMERGHAAFGVMERQLQHQPFLAGDAYSVADIALFAYTHVADEGGYELTKYPGVRDWLARVAARPGFRAMREG